MKSDKKFIVTKRPSSVEDKSVIMTVRLDRALQERIDKIAYETNRSRNEIVNLALMYAVENAEIKPVE